MTLSCTQTSPIFSTSAMRLSFPLPSWTVPKYRWLPHVYMQERSWLVKDVHRYSSPILCRAEGKSFLDGKRICILGGTSSVFLLLWGQFIVAHVMLASPHNILLLLLFHCGRKILIEEAHFLHNDNSWILPGIAQSVPHISFCCVAQGFLQGNTSESDVSC